MWHHRYLFRIDLRLILVIFSLMIISIYVISSMTTDSSQSFAETLFSPYVKNQIKWFIIGWIFFLVLAGFDYRKLRELTWFLYALMVILLLGLYFVGPIQNVHRWYRLPWIGMNVQPSEITKLVVVLTLAWFLEKKGSAVDKFNCSLQIGCIVGIPFFLILKQPDLGTALVLYPITLVMCYFGGIKRLVMRGMSFLGLGILVFTALIFLGTLSHEEMRPFFTTFLKEYQYERLNPNTYHQKAAQTAIAIGGISGAGWHKSDFSSRKWLPAAHTDSVFAAFGEEAGFLGMAFLLFLFYALLYFCFQVATVAKDYFGRLLAAGLTIYLAMHIIMNIAMMCAFLPITGVPLVLISYGGNSVLTTMGALGILQSIYTRRFMF